jgi:hypothetical protein
VAGVLQRDGQTVGPGGGRAGRRGAGRVRFRR